MATDAKILRLQSAISGFPPASLVKNQHTEEQDSVQVRKSEPLANSGNDLFLVHNSTDRPWTTMLANRLLGKPVCNRTLRLALSDLNSVEGAFTPVELRKALEGHRFLAIVVTRTMLREDWPCTQRTLEFLKELAPAAGRIVTILKENVTLPPMLRLTEWFDFRCEEHFEESLTDLMSFLRADFTSDADIPSRSAGLRLDSADRSPSAGDLYSFGVSSAKERIISNLFPVAELPKFVYSMESRFQTESELTEACAGTGPLPFLLKGSRLYSIDPLSQGSVFAPAVSGQGAPKQENFAQWFSRNDRAGWAVELLNNLFRHHAWKRGLRWDKNTDQYHFPRTKPKSLWWEINERTISREVTAPHIGWIELGNQARAEVQYGWRHRSIRAGFVHVQGNLFLLLEPSWMLTELDGKTPATTQPVGPVFSGPQQQERNGQVLRSLRFWSAILAKGHHEIRIDTCQAPIRIKLTPQSGFTQFGIPSDRMDYDRMMVAEMEDDLLMPALDLLDQESIENDEEIISPQTHENSRNEQSQACI